MRDRIDFQLNGHVPAVVIYHPVLAITTDVWRSKISELVSLSIKIKKIQRNYFFFKIEDSGDYVCQAIGYNTHISGQSVVVTLTVEKCKLSVFEEVYIR